MFLHLAFEAFTWLVLILLVLLLEESIFAGSHLLLHRVFSEGFLFVDFDDFRFLGLVKRNLYDILQLFLELSLSPFILLDDSIVVIWVLLWRMLRLC